MILLYKFKIDDKVELIVNESWIIYGPYNYSPEVYSSTFYVKETDIPQMVTDMVNVQDLGVKIRLSLKT